jgi:DNA invertase Pin-like site-specific DNA recombinase
VPKRPHKRVAWANRKYKGRKPTGRARVAEVLRLADEGLHRTEIAERLDIGVASVSRVLVDAKKGAGDRTVTVDGGGERHSMRHHREVLRRPVSFEMCIGNQQLS